MLEKAALLKGYLTQEVVTLPSGAGEVLVRGLTRHEATEVSRGVDKIEDDDDRFKLLEERGIAAGLLEPKLTVDEVRAWRESAVAADVQAVANAITKLSNLDEGAGKGPTTHSRRRRN